MKWADVARVARGAALTERSQEYVDATRAMAFSSTRILFRHIRPNHPYTQGLMASLPELSTERREFTAIQGELPPPPGTAP